MWCGVVCDEREMCCGVLCAERVTVKIMNEKWFWVYLSSSRFSLPCRSFSSLDCFSLHPFPLLSPLLPLPSLSPSPYSLFLPLPLIHITLSRHLILLHSTPFLPTPFHPFSFTPSFSYLSSSPFSFISFLYLFSLLSFINSHFSQPYRSVTFFTAPLSPFLSLPGLPFPFVFLPTSLFTSYRPFLLLFLFSFSHPFLFSFFI